MYSVSKKLIWDVHQILNILGIYSFVRIPKKRDAPVVFPTYTTPWSSLISEALFLRSLSQIGLDLK